jgi:hypothetical protein
VCIIRRIFHFKAQQRWLEAHPEMLPWLGFEQVPHRTTFSGRYKQLYDTLQEFVAFLGTYASELDPAPMLPGARAATNVQTCLDLATLSVQIAMIANSIWGLPLRNISAMATVFTRIMHTPH